MEKKLILEVTRYIKRTGTVFNITVEHLCMEDDVQDIVNSEIKLWDLASTDEVEYYIRRVILLDYIEPTIEDVIREVEEMKLKMPKVKEQKCEDITDSTLYNYAHYIEQNTRVENIMKKYGKDKLETCRENMENYFNTKTKEEIEQDLIKAGYVVGA